ncbi:MAG: methylated-DNA--[protein]-cysteine S-methyltransferase [Nitrospirales bacterium]|nr:methylated-DNA--[protein]-cysteine S-methyltransferase [Nitrospirales bacterium]
MTIHTRTTLKASGQHNLARTKCYYYVTSSPVGKLLLAGDQHKLTLISFQEGKHPMKPPPTWTYDQKPFREAIQQLKEYFSGNRTTFTIHLAPQGTIFQLAVWQALKTIPYGTTVSYGDIAKAIGRPNASRAVGAANGQNPHSIIVPCHRVIGSTGKLVGYGGGLNIKAKLLALEHQVLSQKT